MLQKKIINVNLLEEIHLGKSCSHHTSAITQEEISIFFNTISKSSDKYSLRDKTLFAVYAFTGIRKSEALALQISDYDRVSKILYLPQSKYSLKRYQTIPAILSQILDKYLQTRFRLTTRGNSLPLFPGYKQNVTLSPRQASNRFNKWKMKSGIRHRLTIHSFRSSYASRLYLKTKDPLLVSYALGHSSFETTKRYITEEALNFRMILENTF